MKQLLVLLMVVLGAAAGAGQGVGQGFTPTVGGVDETATREIVGDSLTQIRAAFGNGPRYANIIKFGVTDNFTGDLNPIIASMKAAGYSGAKIPAITITPTAQITLSDFSLIGAGMSQTVIDITSAPAGFVIDMTGNAEVQYMTIVGPLTESDIVSPATPWFSDLDEVSDFNGIGTVSAIKKGGIKTRVYKVEFIGVNAWCIKNNRTNSGSQFGNASSVEECRFKFNYGALYYPSFPDPDITAGGGAEYLHTNANTINYNVIGVAVGGGNNTFGENRIDHNEAGVVLLEGHNDSHGSFTGGSINHSKFVSVLADSIKEGEIFSGISMFDGGTNGIYLRNSRGVKFIGCSFSRMNVNAEGQYVGNIVDGTPTGTGINTISNSTFSLHGGTYQVNRNVNGEADNLVMYDNFLTEGSLYEDPALTWDEDIVNTSYLDRFGYRQTSLNNYTVVAGQPVDGWGRLGAGTQLGALAIKLPFAFGNTLVSLRVKSVGWATNIDNFDYTIQGYALSSGGGTWTGINVQKKGENLPVRLGRSGDGFPLVYIGELTSQWRDALFVVEEMTAHNGSLSATKKYFKTGWELALETTAFENVTQELPGGNYIGDLNTLSLTGTTYAESTATNKPGSLPGIVRTELRGKNNNVRNQTYTETTGNVYHRSSSGGSGNYLGWDEVMKRSDIDALIRSGSGTPEGTITATPGTLYLNTAGGANTTLYVKETGTGNTGWVAK